MIHNFWSHKYLIDRVRYTAEEYSIMVKEISEAHTSDTCPRCDSRKSKRKGRLFRCLNCGLEAHRDAVGVLNMANLQLEGTAIGVMAHPLLLRWDGMRWDCKSGMNDQRDEHSRSKNLLGFSRGECQLP